MTLADLESDLIDRCSDRTGTSTDLMFIVGMSTVVIGTVLPDTTTAGPNPSLRGALAWALHTRAIPMAETIRVTDADLATLSADQWFAVLDFAEYRLLQNCLNRWTRVRTQVGANSLYLSDVGDRINRRLTELYKELKDRYGYGLQAPQVVAISGAVTRSVCGLDEFGSPDRWDGCDEFGNPCWRGPSRCP